MSKSSPSPLAVIRDVFVGTTIETEREQRSSAIGYGLTLAKAAGAHLTVLTEGLATGVYVLRLTAGASVITKRVVIN